MSFKLLPTEEVSLGKGDGIGRELILRYIADHMVLAGMCTTIALTAVFCTSSQEFCASSVIPMTRQKV